MKALLLSWGLGLLAALQAQALPTPALGEQEILGKWYVNSVALKAGVPVEKVSPLTISMLDSGDLLASVEHTAPGHCHKVENVLKRTDVPDQYLISGGMGYLQVEGSSVKDHCLFYVEGEFEGEKFQVAKLMGRSPEENPEALEEFKRFIQRKGLPLKNIYKPEHIDSCDAGHD